ncbi:uncharacterized protein [Nicotiana tomentosiformis]|uniref:uncharacterized protein n=1 Tax=Nicotiana tomentosiformis TaxID=4098 RepID=UPI00388C3651
MDELVGNLKTYEMKRKKDSERREPKKEKNLVLKAENNDSSKEDSEMAYLTRRFQKMVRRNGGIPKRGSSSKPKNYDLCHKCGKPRHFIKDCPLLKQEHFKHNSDKAAKRNSVPDKCFKRKNVADRVVKQDLTAWGDSSSESEEENDAGDSSMMAVENEANEYDSIFALMAQSDDDEDDDNDEVNFRDVQRNLKSYSPKKLMSLANVLIDAYHSLVSDNDALTIELGDAEQTRDDLVVCVVDLKETIENLKNEKEFLTEKIASVEHERDDLMIVVVDLKEITKNFSKEKNALVEKIAITEQERDDFLGVIVDLEETIEGLKAECRPGNFEKGKQGIEMGTRKRTFSKTTPDECECIENVGGMGSTSTISQLINAQNSATEEIKKLNARNAILETQLSQAIVAPGPSSSSSEEVARLSKENAELSQQVENLREKLLAEQMSANARIDLVLNTLVSPSKPSFSSAPYENLPVTSVKFLSFVLMTCGSCFCLFCDVNGFHLYCSRFQQSKLAFVVMEKAYVL